jgi:FtsP/CotA-like multicopper oxidase with cupredoxin domain
LKCNASRNPGRRAFLKHSGLAAVGTWLAPLATAAAREIPGDPTHVLHIRKGQVELAPGHRITTTTYDGQLPGPLLRATVGRRVLVDVHNETDTAERMSWHGQDVADETSLVPAHSRQRMEFTPGRPGLYLYHSGVIAAANLDAGLYSGQVGALLVEPENQPHRRDREWVVVLKDCEPSIHRTRRGCEVAYGTPTVNGRLPAFAEPLRINTGERVLIHVLNASATQSHTLALPGHSFEVTALDGNPVPSPAAVQALHLSPGERISARVEMHRPGGGWILRGPTDATWDYTRFGSGTARAPDETLALVLTRHEAARSGFNRWSINGTSFSTTDPRPLLRVQHGRRYRLKIRNTSDEILPMHLQHHRLEIASIAGRATAGVVKDVVSVGAHEQVEVDFLADSRGPALFYCTRQLHKDFGLMGLIEYA